MTDNRKKQLQELKKQFDHEVVKPYDSRLQGNYFINQFSLNSINPNDRGIRYTTGGLELAEKGAELILPAVKLYSEKFEEKYREINSKYESMPCGKHSSKQGKILREQESTLQSFNEGIRDIKKEQRRLSQAQYIRVYSAIGEFKKLTPEFYRQNVGEMIFHQSRILNMCHLGENDPFQFRDLDWILQDIPNTNFLGDKLYQVGEGLVREILASKEGYKPSKYARPVIERYNLFKLSKSNPEIHQLIKAVDLMEAQEIKHNKKETRLTQLLKTEKEKYIEFRKEILGKIGAKMHDYDYRE